MLRIEIMKRKHLICYEGEGDPPKPPEGSGNQPPDGQKPPPVFSQDQVNTLLATDRRKGQEQNAKTIKQLEELQRTVKMSAEQKGSLETQLEELRTANLTTEERARREGERLKNEHAVSLKNMEVDRDGWKGKFVGHKVTRDITDAAVGVKAFSPHQIVSMLERSAHLTEIELDGKPTGDFLTKIKFNDTDKDGKPVVLDLTVTEVLKRMKELPEKFGNLFVDEKTGGLGATGSSTQTTANNSKAPTDPVAYRAWREKNLARSK